jgi:cell division transport system ATP-binding protein
VQSARITPSQTPISQASSTSATIRLEGVSKTYPNGRRCLSDINLQLSQGEFLFITGASGAGKSTLLKLLYGAEKPSSGRVIFEDVAVEKLRGDRLARIRRKIGIVFQDYKLIENRTVGENVAFVLWAQGYAKQEICRRLIPTLQLVGLADKVDQFPKQLSGGEQQRISLARAIISTPSLILADEPTGNLDLDNSQQILILLEKMSHLGATVIVTTHDQNLIRMSNQPVMDLYEGQLYWIRK